MACNSSLMLAEGIWADVRVAGEHIQLFAERNALGVQASIYDVNAKKWIAPSEFVDDLQQAKNKAAALAEIYLKQAVGSDLPPLEWKDARSK
jgi:hypothetical protein